ncbi:helix-turn-helix domain-containing protein [uncultured Dokdonia sp.]|uniref:helix-turn-helix domain-containing protein n=1 Tax=uncultured Dokdonia sp. TaxID=575653 RepID=UPI002633F838|nr:helix-turn-helix domain-containing protein [uncultured Dokdonia sp.]
MSFLDILLIIISSAGLLHGVLFAIYLCVLKKKKPITNILLSLILFCMAFRIGKSVILNFGHDLEPLFIFAGLAFLLLIGPLLRWYVQGMTQYDFKLPTYYYVELIPFVVVFLMSFFLPKGWFGEHNKQAIIVFGSILIFIYLHFATYIFSAITLSRKAKKNHNDKLHIKEVNVIFKWLPMLLTGFIVIWFSYVLNIIEDTVPYIIGPIMYSIVIYFLSYKAYTLKVIDIDGTIFEENNHESLFQTVKQLMIEEKLYLTPDISLSKLGKLLGVSAQKTSKIINQQAGQNFNDFINYYRIQDAKMILLDPSKTKYTISSVAFDTGFSSLSSFNSAFKKFEAMTPSAYRDRSKV